MDAKTGKLLIQIEDGAFQDATFLNASQPTPDVIVLDWDAIEVDPGEARDALDSLRGVTGADETLLGAVNRLQELVDEFDGEEDDYECDEDEDEGEDEDDDVVSLDDEEEDEEDGDVTF